MNWISFRGVRTDSLPGVIVAKMPSHKRAAMRYTEYRVNGRDGVLHVNEGYDSFEIKCRLMLFGQAAISRQIVNAWADGTGKLITSDDPARAYNASALQEVRWTRDEENGVYYDSAEITFTCQPYMVEATESTQEFTASGSIVNQGDAESHPLIEVRGSANRAFSVAGQDITLTGVGTTPVFIDCENGYVYTANGAATMTGEFPVLPIGTSAVTITSGVTKIIITPRWRWL